MFSLKANQNKNGSRLIYLIFNYHANRFKLSTGLNIHPDLWDDKRERPKRHFRYYTQYNALLDLYDKTLHEAYYDLLLNCIPSKAMLKAAITERIRKPQAQTVADYCDQYAANKVASLGTIRQFRLVAKWVRLFDAKLTFDQIDLATMIDFRDFLYGKKLAANSVAPLYKRFKTVLNDAVEKGVTANTKHKNRKAAAQTVDTTQIFLNEDDLDKIRTVELPEHLEKHRDILLVSCYTGTRFTDIFKINRSAFVENGRYFRIIDQKENALAQIPLHPVVLEIMNRYEWNLPKVSNPVFNRCIKEVGRLAKVDQMINVVKYPGNVRTNTVVPKWAMIVAHTGRRSLICNLILDGMNRESIKSISGHRSDAAYMKYVRLTPSDHLTVAHRSGFFTSALKAVK